MRFEFIAGAICLDFANTIHDLKSKDNGEELHAVSDVLQWAGEARLLSPAERERLLAHFERSPRQAAAVLANVRSIRDLLLAIFAGVANGRAVSPQQLSDLNSAFAQVPCTLRVRRYANHTATEWATKGDGIDRVLFAVLTSAADLLASNRLHRIRECSAPHCTWLFVDESRNRSRRWCDMRTCGNRMKARRHYQRAQA